jgi:hypothetical protein
MCLVKECGQGRREGADDRAKILPLGRRKDNHGSDSF